VKLLDGTQIKGPDYLEDSMLICRDSHSIVLCFGTLKDGTAQLLSPLGNMTKPEKVSKLVLFPLKAETQYHFSFSEITLWGEI